MPTWGSYPFDSDISLETWYLLMVVIQSLKGVKRSTGAGFNKGSTVWPGLPAGGATGSKLSDGRPGGVDSTC